ncbi:MAG: WD40/YVTN/BNR-like repeat-containing protein [Sphingobacteriales bacterium]
MRSLFLIGSMALCLATTAQNRPSTGADRQKAFQQQKALAAKSPYKSLQWRNVGPDNISGRVSEVLGVPGNKNIIWASFATGGFWKTEDAGKSWKPLFDNEGTLSVGSFDVAKSNSNIIYLGSGEANIFRASLPGMGVYKSEDGGKSWKHIGLENTSTISRVIIHPSNPNHVYVAASGNEWSNNKERGLYETTDGGKTWKRLINDDANGVIDLVMHPTDPKTMYASTWNRIRLRWSDPTPQDGDFIWKTTDGGKTWTKLTNGLPQTKFTGRVGIALSRSNPNILYAYIDNHTPKREPKAGELDPYGRPIQVIPFGVQVWRSDDAGQNFAKVSTEDDKLERFAGTYGWVFGQIRVDPTNPEVVYIMGVPIAKSTDGGKTFNMMRPDRGSERNHGDHHALWIDPTDPNYLINGNDGGVVVSYDGGKTLNNFFDVIPTTQFYNITYDMNTPYNVIGSVQDEGSFMASVKNTFGSKDPSIQQWRDAPGGEGTIHAVDPSNPSLVYSSTFYGRLTRSTVFKDSIASKNIFPKKADDEEVHRGEWLAYTLLSPHDNKTLYHGFQYLFKSTDQGETWKRISGDLTYNDVSRMGRTPYAINHQAITAIDESPITKGVLYVGTDDGRVWVTMNDGGAWTEITKGLPERVHVSRLVASKYDAGTVYITLSDRREDNIKPYLFRSTDYGKTWTALVTDLPASPVNVVREDPKNANILYCGTDLGVYISKDKGKSWQSIQGNLPATVSVNDLFVHPRDYNLVIGTYGRGVWVVDELGTITR